LADAVVAHNGTAFDYPVLQHWAKKHNLDWESGKTWIDTNCDLYPNQRPTTLTHLAADHGFLNPFSHRASFDVVTMLKILDCYNIPHILEVAKSPTLTIQAIVDYANNDKARALHYRAEYKNEKFQYWGKTIRACYLEQEREAARLIGFDIEIIKTKV
jgi:DNA polymerase III alpha subunit (gram-positive type)